MPALFFMQPLFEAIAEEVNQKLIDYWEMQGHLMTDSRFVRELEYQLKDKGIEGFSVGYARYVNRGTPAEKVPYQRGSGAGKSKYIQGLIRYVENRMGLQDKEAVSVAFAIANKHKKEGMPTDASRQYSQTGQRTNFLDSAFEELERDGTIERLTDEYFFKVIDQQITKAI